MRASMLIVLAFIGLTIGVATPVRRQATLESAAGEVRSMLLLARMRAAERNREVGVLFVRIDGAWHHVFYDDGDGNGVRRDEIAKGIDPPAMAPYPVLEPGAIAVQSVPELCVFAPDGSASPCVIAIGDDGHRQFVTQREVS